LTVGDLPLSPVAVVFLYGLATALATGLGAVPFLFFRHVSERMVSSADALASGLMLGACFSLVVEGTQHGVWQTLVGANLGVVFILLTDRYLAQHEVAVAELRGTDARQMLLMVIVMTVHSFSEGVAVGASFAGGMRLAAFITLAIAVHNVPEGLAITAVLRPRGVGLWKCAGWSVFSSLPQPLMAVPAFLFVEAFRPALPYSIGFAAGAMVYMVFVELLPEAYEQRGRVRVGLLVTLALVGMLLFQRYL
jgi:zinc transporter ZupT